MSYSCKIKKSDISGMLYRMQSQYNKNNLAYLSSTEQQLLNNACDSLEDIFAKLGHEFNRKGFITIVRRLYPKGEMLGGSPEGQIVPFGKSNTSSSSRRTQITRQYDFISLLCLLVSIVLFYLAYVEYMRLTTEITQHEMYPLLKAIAEQFELSLRESKKVKFSFEGLTWFSVVSKYISNIKCIVNLNSAPAELIMRVIHDSVAKLSDEIKSKCIVKISVIDGNSVGPSWMPLVKKINDAANAVYNLAADPTASVFASCSMRTSTQLLNEKILKMNEIRHISTDGVRRICQLIGSATFTFGAPSVKYIYNRVKSSREKSRRIIK